MQGMNILRSLFKLGFFAIPFSSALAEGTALKVGDAQLQIRFVSDVAGIYEGEFLVDGQVIAGLSGNPACVEIEGSRVRPALTCEHDSDLLAGAEGLIFTADDELANWRLSYHVTGPGRITKTLSITPKRDIRLERVMLWESSDPHSPAVARTPLQDIAAFYRQQDRGLFVSLDFPYSQIHSNSGHTSVSYPPFLELKADRTHLCHSLTLGATRLTGIARYSYDDGEVRAMDRYIQERFPVRFERPMFVSASIVNRYTQVSDTVFYTMKDHPTLRDNTDLLERDLALMPKLGMEYYQVFPGVFDWGPDDPSPQQVDHFMEVARQHGVRMGDYSGTNRLFCWHYNEYNYRLDKPEWRIKGNDKRRNPGFCFGHPDFVDYYIDKVVPACKRFGFEIHCLDFLGITPCTASEHGHPAGRVSIYHQVSGLVRLMQAISDVSPYMMTWSNSGNWTDFLPKIAWYNPNLYLTDPFIVTPWQGLNMTRLLDDARREQMVSLHHTHFIPYRFLTNCQYFFSQNSIVPDIRNFEYGALSTLAVTPNLCLGEIRPWLDRLNEADRKRVFAFYQHWTDFIRRHFGLWKKTFHAGENPGPGAVEIYGHAEQNHGFVFIVNPQYWSRTVEVPLDDTLGFSGQGPCEVAELYPIQRLRLTPYGPTIPLGTKLVLHVPAQQVIVLEIRPAPEQIDTPRLYGLPGSIQPDGDHYLLKTCGPQGRAERFAVTLPEQRPCITSAKVRADVPKQPLRLWAETPIRLLNTEQAAATFELRFRREPAPTELRDWTVRSGTFEEGMEAGWKKGLTGGKSLCFPLFVNVQEPECILPLTCARADVLAFGPLANFCGGYIENAFSEQQETWITLRTNGIPETQPALTAPVDSVKELRPLPPEAKDPHSDWWLQTHFHLPFMYTVGAEPAFDEHTFLVLPQLEPTKCRSIHAWINGNQLEVRRYRYPRNRNLACYYADLVGSGAKGGENTLVVHLQY